MKENHQSTQPRIGNPVKFLIKYFWEIASTLLGIYSIAYLLYEKMFERSISFSELDFSELIFVIALLWLTINYCSKVKASKASILRSIECYFLPQGCLFVIGQFIIRHNILWAKSYLDEPILYIACLICILMGFGISFIIIRESEPVQPAPKQIASDIPKENHQ